MSFLTFWNLTNFNGTISLPLTSFGPRVISCVAVSLSALSKSSDVTLLTKSLMVLGARSARNGKEERRGVNYLIMMSGALRRATTKRQTKHAQNMKYQRRL